MAAASTILFGVPTKNNSIFTDLWHICLDGISKILYSLQWLPEDKKKWTLFRGMQEEKGRLRLWGEELRTRSVSINEGFKNEEQQQFLTSLAIPFCMILGCVRKRSYFILVL
jgi:hypothetical protein